MRVIVIGGLGNFGARICQRLSKVPGLTVIAACRKPESRTHTFAFGQIVSTLALDIHSADFEIRLIEAAPRLVIHCAGPFQGQDYRVALASCAAGAHYMYLADGRDFVANFAAQVDASAKAAGVLAVSGASSVPGLSSAVVDHLSKSLLRVNSISIVGNVPEIPCMATVLLACKLADGELELTGAFPCMGLLKLEEFDAEFQRWDITSEIAEEIL